jgi:hypothetical protein
MVPLNGRTMRPRAPIIPRERLLDLSGLRRTTLTSLSTRPLRWMRSAISAPMERAPRTRYASGSGCRHGRSRLRKKSRKLKANLAPPVQSRNSPLAAESRPDWRIGWIVGRRGRPDRRGLRGAFGSNKPCPTENAPPGRRGVSGVTTGRRDMYLYICGSVGGRWALMCRGASRWESTAIFAAPGPTRKFSKPFIDPLS